MGTQKGILKVKGKLDDLSFYKSKGGYMVREKGGIDAGRIKKDPAFQRTREHGREFAMACRTCKLLRMVLAILLRLCSDGSMTLRLVRIVSLVKYYDLSSRRGDRHMVVGITGQDAKALFHAFSFNIHTQPELVLKTIFETDVATGNFTVPDFCPDQHLVVPPNAAHIAVKCAVARVDFLEGSYALSESEVQPYSVRAVKVRASGVTIRNL